MIIMIIILTIFHHVVVVVLAKHQDKVLKPMIKPNLFLREVNYYEEFSQATAVPMISPIVFLPRYYGGCMLRRSLDDRGGYEEIEYLCLEDLTRSVQCSV